MNNNFPEGTIISGDLAFVPNTKENGGGFITVDIKTGKKYNKFSDHLVQKHIESQKVKEVEMENINDMVNSTDRKIEFDIDYDGFIFGEDVRKYDDVPSITEETSSPKVKKSSMANENIHKGHRERMKKRFIEYGLSNFAEHEVLEMVLYYTNGRRDTNSIAHNLINEFGDLQSVLKADTHSLMSVDGVGEQTALLLNFLRQFMIYVNQNIKEKICLPTSTATGMFCCKYFAQHTEENLIVIVLDTNKNIKKIAKISEGTENETAYYPRKIVDVALKYKANAVLIAHNHTGNSVHPSEEDIVLSTKIRDILNGIGIELVDHIICCEAQFTSLTDRGVL